jgi:hypothetical protein
MIKHVTSHQQDTSKNIMTYHETYTATFISQKHASDTLAIIVQRQKIDATFDFKLESEECK